MDFRGEHCTHLVDKMPDVTHIRRTGIVIVGVGVLILVAPGLFRAAAEDGGATTRPAHGVADGSASRRGAPVAKSTSQPAGTKAHTTPRLASREALAEAVTALGRGSYRRREEAAREIATVGPAAIPLLREHFGSGKEEVALMARELATELEEVFFCGTTVRLEFVPSRIRWDEPVALRIEVTNPTPFDVWIPWADPDAGANEALANREGPHDAPTPAPIQVPAPRSTSAPAPASMPTKGPVCTPGSPAEKLGVILDIADFLDFTDPAGEPVSPSIVAVRFDTRLSEVVNARLEGGPTHVLPAGRSRTYTFAGLNRGLARYRFVDAGRYRVRLVYAPQWTRAEWINDGLGRVESNEAVLDVTETAPNAVRRASRFVSVRVAVQGDTYVALLRSTCDAPQYVNLHGTMAPAIMQAYVRWHVRAGDDEPALVARHVAVPGAVEPAPPDGFRLMAPMEEIEIGRIDGAALRAAVRAHGQPAAGVAPEVVAEYRSMADWEEIADAIDTTGIANRKPLVAWVLSRVDPLFVGSVQSEPVPLPASASKPTSR